jgi:acyl-coenzyme A synthetase/AMP-(fatty) acid ligase
VTSDRLLRPCTTDDLKCDANIVAPAELESLLMSHPDILDAGVIGVKAADGVTELPRAFIVPRGGIDKFKVPGEKSAFEDVVATWIGEQVTVFASVVAVLKLMLIHLLRSAQ